MFRVEWFAKFFEARIVRSLRNLRGKARRRVRDRLLAVLLVRGSQKLHAVLFGGAVTQGWIAVGLQSFVSSVSALTSAIARWLGGGRESRCGHRPATNFRPLRCEHLNARVMLTTNYVLDTGIAAPSFEAPDWQVNGAGNHMAFPNGTTSIATIPSSAVQTTITVSSDVVAGQISFGAGYTLWFLASADILGGTISIQSGLIVDVPQGIVGKIDSQITGATALLNVQDRGTLDLTNSANSFQSTTIQYATLEIDSDGALGAVPNSATWNITFAQDATLETPPWRRPRRCR
jgi:hypothetical protein